MRNRDAIRIRRATLRDLDVLVRHRRGMWMAMGLGDARMLDDHDREYRRWVRTRMKSGRFVGWVAVPKGRGAVASGGLWLRDAQPHPRQRTPRHPYLLSMFTEPTHRGRGLATRITREAIRWSKAQGYPVLYLHASLAGEPVYRALGFEPTREMRLRLRRL